MELTGSKASISSPLTDRFGRKHDYLRISLTDKCNLRCVYCMPENVRFMPQAGLMNKEEVLQFARLFVEELGVKKIRLTGGEPLLRQDAADILRGLAELPVELAITTNGIFLDRFFNLFEEIGLRSINVSLDSLKKERFEVMTRRPQFDQVMGNITEAIKRGIHLKINAVVIADQNEDEILDFVEWTKDTSIHVRFIEFMPFDGNKWHWEKVVKLQTILEKLAAVYPLEKLNDELHATSKAYRVPGFRGSFAIISSITAPFCTDCNRLRLTADGKIRNCLFATDEQDLLSKLRAGEDVRELIREAVERKHAQRGGLPEFENEARVLQQLDGRAMVKIGG